MVTVPGLGVGLVLAVVMFPVAVLVDVVFRRWRFGTVRIVGFVLWYLLLGVVIQLGGLAIWVLSLFGTPQSDAPGDGAELCADEFLDRQRSSRSPVRGRASNRG